MTQRKKLIEVALPLEAINAASAREKSIRHGHPSTLHLWWARRPLAAARAVIFTSLVDDPDSEHAPKTFVEACEKLPKGNNAKGDDTPRMRLFDFIERLVTWEATTDEAILEQARDLIRLSTDGNPPPLLDPFAGGGSIPLEAQRLGLEAHASDLNPVAVMINKAQIEIPPRFADMPPVNPRDRENDTGGDATWKGAAGLAADVRYYGEWMRDKAYEKIGHLYPEMNGETVIAWIWVRTMKCPNPACGAIMPLASTLDVSRKKGKRAWVEPIINNDRSGVSFVLHQTNKKSPDAPKQGRGSSFKCLVCSQVADKDYLKSEAQTGRMGSQMIGVVTEGDRGRNYHSVTDRHIQVAENATPNWEPDFDMSKHPQYMAPPRYGMTSFKDLFTARQSVALSTLSELLDDVITQLLEDSVGILPKDETPLHKLGNGNQAYAEAVAFYLGLNIGRQANRLSALCFWHPTREKVEPFFSRQAFTMNWNFAEANPFSDSSGNFLGQLDYLTKVVENLPTKPDGFVIQRDAVNGEYPDQRMVSTDPPYYDNVPYADLSDFFYVWLRHSMRKLFPDIMSTMLVPKSTELVADHQRLGGRDEADAFFEDGMKKVFANIYDITLDYPLTVYYAFKQAEVNTDDVASTGWETMLEGLIQSGFHVLGTWPVRTEQTTNIKKFRNALASSIVLVCRPRPEDAPQISRREFVSLLRQELPQALEEMQSGNIAPVDLAQSSIGPGMAVYSRYSQVLEADGTPLTVRTALQIINQELDAYLSETEGHIDADSRFAVAWFDQNGFDEGEFGQADVLARAKNTSVSGIEDAHIIESGHGKVRLLTVHELYEMNPDWNPADDKRATTWEAVHHLIARLQRYGESGAALLMLKMHSEMAAEARQLAYRLYSICERKGWADHARDYNALVVQWSDIQSEVSTQREAIARGDATRQTSMFDDES